MRKPYQIRPVPRYSGKQSPKPGFCTHCGKLASKEALFKVVGTIVIEKYCDACMEPKEFDRIQTIYSRIG